MPDIVSKLLCAAIWSCCAVWFESEQMTFSKTGCRLRSGALQMIQFGTRLQQAVLLLCHNFTQSLSQRSINDWKIESMVQLWFVITSRSIENFLVHFAWKRSVLSLPESYNAQKPFWLSNWVRISSVVARFSSSKPVSAQSDCSWLRNAMCLCFPIWPAQDVQEGCPKSLAIDFAVKIFDCILEWPSGLIAW